VQYSHAANNMSEVHLSLAQARTLQLAAMGLLKPHTAPATKRSVLAAIRAMHALQIDTISVVARSPYLVLFSRLGPYDPCWLDELLAEGKLFEYWAHAACFLPMDDYPLYRVRQLAFEHYGFHQTAARLDHDAPAHLNLLDRVRATGAVRATDFEHENGRKGNGWWDWKPDKLRLERLFIAGELMVSHREKFHRIYDLRERVLRKRSFDDTALPTREETHLAFTSLAVKAMGVTQWRWIDDYFWRAQKKPRLSLNPLLESGQLLQVRVEGWKEPAYVHRDRRSLLRAASSDSLVADHSTVLSPFDPLVWDRERALTLFNFDYRIECYTPAAKRKYGYFTLPVLVRGQLVGRLDAKAHRAEGVFEVRALHFEPGVVTSDPLAADVADAVYRCAQWHATPVVQISKTIPRNFMRSLQLAVKQRARIAH
jgi:uncharacterized protein